MLAPAELNSKVNLEKACILLIERGQHNLDILSQIVKGFGAGNLVRCLSAQEAKDTLVRKPVDLVIAEPNLEGEDGLELVRWLRASPLEPNRFTSVALIMGHTSVGRIEAARDCGANVVIAKPLKPAVLLSRILRIARDERAFVETANYIGPDRRFKFEGPPMGVAGRRSTDLNSPIGDASEPNLSQDDIDAFMRPQRIQL
ncbi:chemotaxis protein CheYIII [alpha proteobacterium U9-1i]|nr:chemotaxis protein CheYIII [alpha proteobacterium U9-1i]